MDEQQDKTPVQSDAGLATQQQPAAGTPSTPEAAAQEQAQTPLYVTKDDLARFGDSLISRMKQSDRDRTARIDKELSALKATITAANVPVTPQQEQAMREQIASQIDQATSQGSTGQINQNEPPDFVAGFLGDVFKETGTAVGKTDPEWVGLQQVIDATWNDPNGAAKVSIAAVRASEAKAKRIAANQETAAARVIGGGGQPTGQPQTTDAPASKLWSEAYKT